MKEVKLSVLVLMHPNNYRGCYEVLFSYDGERYATVDGNDPEFLKTCGLTTAHKFEATEDNFYRLMAKSLATKLKMVNIHLLYKDSQRIMKMFKILSERCVNAQNNTMQDLDIPEIVIAMANSVMHTKV